MKERTGNHSDAKERLSECALNLFVEKGYSATSVRDIVRAAGLTNPVLYYHYGSKEGLFLSVLEEAENRFFEVLDQAAGGEDSLPDYLKGVFRAYFSFTEKNLALVRLAYLLLFSPPGSHPPMNMERFRKKQQEILGEIAGRMIRKGGHYRDMTEIQAVRMLRGIIHIHVLGRLTGEIARLDEKLVIRLVNHLVRVAGNSTARKQRKRGRE